MMTVLLPAAALLLAAGLAGCDDDSDDEPSAREQLEAVGDKARAAYDEPCTTKPRTTDDGLTEPGSLLCYGTPAVVPARTEDGTGRIRITTTAVEFPTGPEEEARRKASDEVIDGGADGSRTIYHRIEFTVLEESEPGSLADFEPTFFDSGVQLDAGSAQSVIAPDPDDCEAVHPDEVAEKGAYLDVPVAACEVNFVPAEGTVLGSVYATTGEVDHGEEYDAIIGDPIRWKAP